MDREEITFIPRYSITSGQKAASQAGTYVKRGTPKCWTPNKGLLPSVLRHVRRRSRVSDN